MNLLLGHRRFFFEGGAAENGRIRKIIQIFVFFTFLLMSFGTTVDESVSGSGKRMRSCWTIWRRWSWHLHRWLHPLIMSRWSGRLNHCLESILFFCGDSDMLWRLRKDLLISQVPVSYSANDSVLAFCLPPRANDQSLSFRVTGYFGDSNLVFWSLWKD